MPRILELLMQVILLYIYSVITSTIHFFNRHTRGMQVFSEAQNSNSKSIRTIFCFRTFFWQFRKCSDVPTLGRALSSQFLLLCISVKYGSPPVAKIFEVFGGYTAR